jgi:hypothetical protein
MSRCVYRKGGSKKYVLAKAYIDVVPFLPKEDIRTDYASIFTDGSIFIRIGYEWDGPSGPTIDTDSFMDGALVHDIFYQMIREKVLPITMRKAADKCLKLMCLQDGMPKWRAWYVYHSVRLFGKGAATA